MLTSCWLTEHHIYSMHKTPDVAPLFKWELKCGITDSWCEISCELIQCNQWLTDREGEGLSDRKRTYSRVQSTDTLRSGRRIGENTGKEAMRLVHAMRLINYRTVAIFVRVPLLVVISRTLFLSWLSAVRSLYRPHKLDISCLLSASCIHFISPFNTGDS